jgi:hypothetical protein
VPAGGPILASARVCTFPGPRAGGDGGRRRAVWRGSCDRPFCAASTGVAVAYRCEARPRRTDTAGSRARSLRTADPAASYELLQQVESATDVAALGDVEHMLDHDGMSVVELEHVRAPSGRSSVASATRRPPPARMRARARRFMATPASGIARVPLLSRDRRGPHGSVSSLSLAGVR